LSKLNGWTLASHPMYKVYICGWVRKKKILAF
jgi:hypothetical protein